MRNWCLSFCAVMIIIVTMAVGIHKRNIARGLEWSDVGTVVSVTMLPGSFSRCNKTEIKTQQYTFVVMGVVGVSRTGDRVSYNGEFIYLWGIDRSYRIMRNAS